MKSRSLLCLCFICFPHFWVCSRLPWRDSLFCFCSSLQDVNVNKHKHSRQGWIHQERWALQGRSASLLLCDMWCTRSSGLGGSPLWSANPALLLECFLSSVASWSSGKQKALANHGQIERQNLFHEHARLIWYYWVLYEAKFFVYFFKNMLSFLFTQKWR